MRLLREYVLQRPADVGELEPAIWTVEPCDLHSRWLNLAQPGQPLFVRESVRHLFADCILPAVLGLMLTLEEESKLNGVVVTGTSGVGKSVMQNWMVAYFRAFLPDRLIVLRNWKSDAVWVVRNGDGTHVTEHAGLSVALRYRLMHEEDIIYIGDAVKNQQAPILATAGFMLLSASPGCVPKDMVDGGDLGEKLPVILPPWSWPEARAAGSRLRKSESDLQQRFNRCGGVPRVLFRSHARMEERLRTVSAQLGRLTLQSLRAAVLGDRADLVDLAQALFHHWPSMMADDDVMVQWCRGKSVFRPASRYTALTLARNLYLKEKSTVNSFRKFIMKLASFDWGPGATLAGFILERRMHELIMRGGEWSARRTAFQQLRWHRRHR
jgi:hypothetical protein